MPDRGRLLLVVPAGGEKRADAVGRLAMGLAETGHGAVLTDLSDDGDLIIPASGTRSMDEYRFSTGPDPDRDAVDPELGIPVIMSMRRPGPRMTRQGLEGVLASYPDRTVVALAPTPRADDPVARAVYGNPMAMTAIVTDDTAEGVHDAMRTLADILDMGLVPPAAAAIIIDGPTGPMERYTDAAWYAGRTLPLIEADRGLAPGTIRLLPTTHGAAAMEETHPYATPRDAATMAAANALATPILTVTQGSARRHRRSTGLRGARRRTSRMPGT